ncbi:hypothetical protein KEH51_03455 [[Brevibacterium] frigoritolerans]|uniref:DUF1980 domain-containing protein n=1 Tax=Peribacillus frigoritolerans TaxID=450367 RepID=A0A941J6V8_9BACI|nr:hypothetical protein [Peribacillus frigoritolerans]
MHWRHFSLFSDQPSPNEKQKQSEQHCDCGSNGESSVLKYGLFFLPILLGFILTDFTLSGEALAKKGMAKQAQMVSSYDSGNMRMGRKSP